MTMPSAHINLAALTANYRFLCTKAGSAEVGGVVKANAYGLGMIPAAKALQGAGCRTFFTAYLSEALALREALPDVTIIALHGIAPTDFAEAAAKSITPMLNDLGVVRTWAAFAREKGSRLPAMIHLDTGMNRLGLTPCEQEELANDHALLEGIDLRGWTSHFIAADNAQSPLTPLQRERLLALLPRLPQARVSLCNSAGLFWGADYVFDLVRPGIALYGGNPTPLLPNPMKAVLELRAPIMQIRPVAPPDTVGYDATHAVPRAGRIATIALGYADGMHRTLSNRGVAMIGGHAAPIVGRISMDLITLDVTDVPDSALSLGATATLIGPHRTIDAIAAEAGTISYEILTSLGERVVRVYTGG